MTVIVIISFLFIVQLNVQFVDELPILFSFEQIRKYLAFKKVDLFSHSIYQPEKVPLRIKRS